MKRTANFRLCLTIAVCVGLGPLAAQVAKAEVSENLLANPSFEEGVDENGLPMGWSLYGAQTDLRRIQLVDTSHEGDVAVLIQDDDPAEEIGIVQAVKIAGDEHYEASVMVRRAADTSTGGSYLQFRFLPSNKFSQVGLVARSSEAYNRIAVKATAPADTTSATIYLYTHRSPTPKVMVDSVQLVSGVEPPPPPPPEPIPPQYDRLKDLCLTTDLAVDGQAAVTIVAPASGRYDAAAARIRQAIQAICGVEVPIASDGSAAGAVPIQGNLIALGNRSTNKTIGELYNRFYCLLDLRYPGPGGHVVRSLHSPFGGVHNVIFAGGSDDGGVQAAADALIAQLQQAKGSAGTLSVGRLMDIELGEGIQPPDIHTLMLLTQPGHLQKIYGRDIGPDERDAIRSQFVKQKVAGATLVD